MSAFPAIPDRLQQGLLDELYLGRALISSSGFTTDPAFHQDGTLASGSVLNRQHLYYNGNSQGGIMGGALTAVSPDFTRAELGVGAMNYSVLLPRSVDYEEFGSLLNLSYQIEAERPLLLDLMQMLWDRGEPDGYAERMTSDPLPGHARPPDPAQHRARRPPGLQLPVRRGGPHDRREGAQAGPVSGTLATHLRDVGRQTDPLLPYTGSAIYYYDIGPIRESSPGSGKFIGTEPPPVHEHPEPRGRGSARRAAGRARDGGEDGLGLLRRGDPAGRRLRRESLLRGRLHRALGPPPASAG